MRLESSRAEVHLHLLRSTEVRSFGSMYHGTYIRSFNHCQQLKRESPYSKEELEAMGCCTSAPKPPMVGASAGKAPIQYNDYKHDEFDPEESEHGGHVNAAAIAAKQSTSAAARSNATTTSEQLARVMSREGAENQQTQNSTMLKAATSGEGNVHKRAKSEDIAENATILGRISQHKKFHFFNPNFKGDPVRILSFLNEYDLGRLTQVNRQFHGLVEGFISIRHAKQQGRPDWTETEWSQLRLGSRGGGNQWNKLKRKLAKEENLNIREEIAEDLTVQSFRERYEAKNLPVLVRGCAQEWKAFASSNVWTFDSLASRFPNSLFRFNDLHGEEILLRDYLLYARSTDDDSPIGLYDSQLGAEPGDLRAVLLNEYKVPACFPEDLFSLVPDDDRPPYRWILLGMPRSGTEMHIDPLETSAWVTVLSGKKKWCLFPPGTDDKMLGGVHALARVEEDPLNPVQDSVSGGIKTGNKSYAPTACEWFLSYWNTPAVKNIEGMVCVNQGPGDTVFVPGGWKHIVLNLEETVAITHNYAPRENLDKIRKVVKSTEPEFYAKLEPKLKEKGLI